MHVPYHVNHNLNGFKTPEIIMQAIELTSDLHDGMIPILERYDAVWQEVTNANHKSWRIS